MFVTKQKDLYSIIYLIQKNFVFTVVYIQCATICKTGVEDEIKIMVFFLKSKNIMVTDWVMLDPDCSFLCNERILKNIKVEMKKVEKVPVLPCINSMKTVTDIIDNDKVITGFDKLFLGKIRPPLSHHLLFDQYLLHFHPCF